MEEGREKGRQKREGKREDRVIQGNYKNSQKLHKITQIT
jgi:hypothetical protein